MKIGIDFGITHTDVAISNDQGTNFQTLKSSNMNPVSYTHLTLPTILLV